MGDEEFDLAWQEISAAKAPVASWVAYKYQQILQSQQIKDYEIYQLEETWRILNSVYGQYENGTPVVERSTDPVGSTALETFKYNVELGFYPPPEVMLCISEGFTRYLSSGGMKSLDEAFFGRQHKMRESLPYRNEKAMGYLLFDLEAKLNSERGVSAAGSVKSLEMLAEEYIYSLKLSEENTPDVDSYLRGYRRWKEQSQSPE